MRASEAMLLGLLGCGSQGPPSAVPASPQAPSAAALADLDLGQRQVDAAAGDCAAACAGVGRMQRARAVLCGPATSACPEAKQRTQAAEAAVASFCDPCGESL